MEIPFFQNTKIHTKSSPSTWPAENKIPDERHADFWGFALVLGLLRGEMASDFEGRSLAEGLSHAKHTKGDTKCGLRGRGRNTGTDDALFPLPAIKSNRIKDSEPHTPTHTEAYVILICAVVAVNNLLQIVKCCRQHNLIDTVMGTAASNTTGDQQQKLQLQLQQQEQERRRRQAH